jgi:hypothetical protein
LANSAKSRLERIAIRAHEIFEARADGQDKRLDDWLQAEREIDGEVSTSTSSDSER